MRTHGCVTPFHASPWDEISRFLAGMALRYPEFGHMAAVAGSMLASGMAGLLAGTTSMHDLIVVPVPVPEPPYDVIAVRAPGSLHPPLTGHVLIEHLSCTGHNDRIERPVSEAVPLFWRFITVKYGIRPPARVPDKQLRRRRPDGHRELRAEIPGRRDRPASIQPSGRAVADPRRRSDPNRHAGSSKPLTPASKACR